MTTIYKQLSAAYLSHDFSGAERLLNQVIDDLQSEAGDVAAAHYLRAAANEDGRFTHADSLDRAYRDFVVVNEFIGHERSDGLLGCARILFAVDSTTNKDSIVTLCHQAVELDGNPKAMMLMGLAMGQLFRDEKSAREWFMRAHVAGSAWGLAFVARSYVRENRYLRARMVRFRALLTCAFCKSTGPQAEVFR